MTLTPEQKTQLGAWLAEGLSLSDIQKKISSEMGIGMTYMELRFLIDDLDLEIVDPAAESEDQEESASESPESSSGEHVVEDADAVLEDSGPSGEGVSVSLDGLTRPGSMASGDVTFSDGQSLGWQLDQMGRLGLIPTASTPEGYQPPEADIPEFQAELQRLLEAQGF